MAHQPNPRVGVIADSTLQRHVLCKAVESMGYTLADTFAPERATDDAVNRSPSDVWLVDIENEDVWSDFIVHLIEFAQTPILLGEGNAPSMGSLQYQRWERKIYAKLKDIIGNPSPRSEDIAVLSQPDISVVSGAAQNPQEESVGNGEPASCIWVLGASLGGPAAVKEFLDALPAGLPIAFIIAQHIDPGFEETLSKVWGRNSAFRFVCPQVSRTLSHGQAVIAPLQQVMTLNQQAQVELYEDAWEGPYAPSIDQVMSLMTDNFGAQTGAILFSGMGNDGAIAAVKMKNLGIPVWAQTAETCANSSMPDSARDTGSVSFSGSPKVLAQKLAEYLTNQYTQTSIP